MNSHPRLEPRGTPSPLPPLVFLADLSQRSEQAKTEQAERHALAIEGQAQRYTSVFTALNQKEAEVDDLQSRCDFLSASIQSIEHWQKSWFRRAFSRWRPVRDGERFGFLRRLERSFRKRCRRFLAIFSIRDKNGGTCDAGPAPAPLSHKPPRCDSGHRRDGASGASRL